MRARHPDHRGSVVRDGIEVSYEVHGTGDPTLLLIPASPITHGRIWKLLVPELARHHRVITIDGRGNGASSRPTDAESYRQETVLGDILAVLDATDTGTALVVAHCHASWWTVMLAHTNPDRVQGLVVLAPGVPYLGKPQQHWVDTAPHWDEHLDNPTGWQLNNRHAITTRHRDWVEFFFGRQLVEAHSTKQFEDAVTWALESTGQVLAAGEEGFDLGLPDREAVEEICRSLTVPTLTIHGDQDICQHVERGRAFAELTGGDLVVLEGAGHLTLARDPVEVIRAIRGFTHTIGRPPLPGRTWTRGASRRKRVLVLSSPIGLGHVRRDLAIVEALRESEPDVEIEWLAQQPATRVIADAGEHIHPASEWLASESAHIASEASGHELNCFQALRSMDEIMVANFMIFQEVVEDGLYDLVVGDEAWDVDYYWHENPELKRTTNVWLTDFVGYLPMPGGGPHEAYLTADYNAEMIEHIARFPRVRDRSIFVGNAADVVDASFGPGLPEIRAWTERNFEFSGYITGFTPPTADQTAEWRSGFGYAADEKICIVTVGGSGVGRALLEKVIAAYPLARAAMPELRMVVVAGPRIDPDSLPAHPGLEVHGYLDGLYRQLAVCDVAVVQGGLTTTMELTAAGRPFLYFPLRNHFEQEFHVRHRLDRYRAGRPMDFHVTDPESLAESLCLEAGRSVSYEPVETDGARRAAGMIAELI